MRLITEVLTCDVCGKQKTTSYVHVGVDRSVSDAKKTAAYRDDEIYEVRPTRHVCGKCLSAIDVAAKQSIAESKKG